MTPAETCRANGWQAGDVLEHSSDIDLPDSPAGLYHVVLTAIGKYHVMGIQKGRENHSFFGASVCEMTIEISGIHWRKVGHMDPFADTLVWPK